MFDQGIHLDVPSAIYFADPAPQPSLTQSIAKILNERSPLHAWQEHVRLGGAAPVTEDEPADKYDSAKAIGNAAHALMIGRGKEVEVVDLDSWRGKAADQRREIEATGRVAILQRHFVRARNMVEVARQRFAGEAFDSELGDGEVVLVWREGDIWLRTMIDWLPSHLLDGWDYKTTGLSCAPHAIPALMLNGDWDIQAAMHERGLDALDPDNAGRRRFRFVAQENTKPYALTVAELPESVLTIGRKKLERAIHIWRECMASGRWPAYPHGIIYPEMPGWAESRWLEREVAEDERRRNGDRDAANLMAG
jgi:hypothetical protein